MNSINAVLHWNEVALAMNVRDHSIDTTEAKAPGPTASAYMLGLVHMCMADACGSFSDAGFKWFKQAALIQKGDSKKATIGGAAYGALSHIYEQIDVLSKARDVFLQELNRSPDGNVATGWKAGEQLGATLARQFWNHEDVKMAIGRDGYNPGPGEHKEDPLNSGQGYYGVRWGRPSNGERRLISPLVLTDKQETDAKVKEPPLLTDKTYEAAWKEVHSQGEINTVTGTEAEKIALFWAYDGANGIGTPPRLYNQHLLTIGRADGINLDDENTWARLLALCNLALADGGIVCWTGKYKHRIWRPIVGIWNEDKVTLPDSYPTNNKWQPFGSPVTNPKLAASSRIAQVSLLGASKKEPQFTPPFPSYPSGHATFGSACFTVLRLVRDQMGKGSGGSPEGNELDISLESDELNGKARDHRTGELRPSMPRHFTRIKGTASEPRGIIEENGDSRIFQGVHWRFDSTAGITSGEQIGNFIFTSAYGLTDLG